MPDSAVIDDDRANDELLLDSFDAVAPATLEPCGDEIPTTEWTGPRCEKCDAPRTNDVVSICRRCGWYASLGTFVELDPIWETEQDDESAAAQQPESTNLLDLVKRIPRWAWVIIASAMGVIVESVVARLVTPDGSGSRTAWSLVQLTIGFAAVASGHVINFLILAADDAEVGLLDLLLKPIKLWTRTFRNLPGRLWLVDAAVCGLVAAIMSFLVIGGLPYERLWDWGVKEAPKQDLMGAVMNRVKQLDSGEQDGDLEKSVNDFAGKGDIENKDKPKPEPPKPINKTDCVIVGYWLDGNGQLTSLLLGTANRGELVYAGSVRPKLAENELKELATMLKAIEIKKPFIKIETEAIWVQAKYTCRVVYGKRAKTGHLTDIQWDKMLGRIESQK
jgi:hypothetical protein